ncbi:MAG: diaminopropionate ammonia-lyase [Clostridia bacterium]|nr:diaminopropionate ammonia-lyase [Clostridia bacterium]
MNEIKYCNINHKMPLSSTDRFGKEEAAKARKFHETFAEYCVTPLAELKNLAEILGIKDFYVKDESYRFGLNAFKALGGTYCVGKCIEEAKANGNEGKLTFVTATDGNHGRGIAWAAAKQGHDSYVYMPHGSAAERLDNILKSGATHAEITDMNYDDAVRFANSQAQKNGWIMVQDTAWEGYEKYPTWIMQGYTTMALEAVEQLGDVKPTHVFLQAGVGAMSGAVTAFIANYYGDENRPKIIIVEPEQADCIYQTSKADDGKCHAVGGALDSIMAGLNCGEPCTIGWEMLRDHADYSVSMPNEIAAKGMRILGNPAGDDPRVVSGESGAAGAGFAAQLITDAKLADFKKELGIDENSVILCFSTEGDTDKKNYRDIVWEGLYPSF